MDNTKKRRFPYDRCEEAVFSKGARIIRKEISGVRFRLIRETGLTVMYGQEYCIERVAEAVRLATRSARLTPPVAIATTSGS